jgi:hypothetical protein
MNFGLYPRNCSEIWVSCSLFKNAVIDPFGVAPNPVEDTCGA